MLLRWWNTDTLPGLGTLFGWVFLYGYCVERFYLHRWEFVPVWLRMCLVLWLFRAGCCVWVEAKLRLCQDWKIVWGVNRIFISHYTPSSATTHLKCHTPIRLLDTILCRSFTWTCICGQRAGKCVQHFSRLWINKFESPPLDNKLVALQRNHSRLLCALDTV